MKFCRRSFLHLTGGLALTPALSRSAQAQTYPTRPITMILPFAAGGPTDAHLPLWGGSHRARPRADGGAVFFDRTKKGPGGVAEGITKWPCRKL
jgi:hypothetical protein